MTELTKAIEELSPQIPKRRALSAIGVSHATFYRYSTPQNTDETNEQNQKKIVPQNALVEEEKSKVMEILCSERFVDRSPYEVYATLLDEGEYLCSIRTMYRLLNENECCNERRTVARRSQYEKPELIATKPNQVWSWDITKLKGAQKWTYFHLYVMLDIYSRYVVGWMVATRENAKLAQAFIQETVSRYPVIPKELTIHSDRGSPMTAKTTSQLHADLGILQSLSRPQVSNDNPFSEATFKTIKYSAGFPDRFANIVVARTFCSEFFTWYNREHRHTGLALFTPEMVHYNQIEKVALERQNVLDAAFSANPARFSRQPIVQLPQTEVFINPPLRDIIA